MYCSWPNPNGRYRNHMLKYATLIYLISMPVLAYGTFTCKELDRISLAAEGSMTPAYS